MRKQVFILFSLSLMFFSMSCSSNDDSNSCSGFATNGEEVSANLIAAALEYFADPTSLTCSEYENAGEAYIDYSNSILNCLETDDRAELEQQIQELEAELAGLNCG